MLTKCDEQQAKVRLLIYRDAYREAYEQCRMNGDSLPRATAIQELVTVWKQLWEWRRRG
jgi:hypothetical protein